MIKTVDEMVDALGGTAAVAALTEVGLSAVSNWRAQGFVPAKKFVTLTEALARKKLRVDQSLFSFK
jgi:hypothetical protein